MAITYREGYVANRRTYGIEDRESASPRFRLWAGGSAIGATDTIEEARKLLHTYICNQLNADRASAEAERERAHATLLKIEGDVFYLGRVAV